MSKNTEEEKIKTVISKSKKVDVTTRKGGSYSYRYTELSDINNYIDSIDETYYQFIERVDGFEYINTVRQKDGKESNPIRGCRLIEAPISNEYSNPAQEQGSALTYARRYSLLMAYGLATEDDDATSLNRPKTDVKMETKEDAENYVIKFGKHSGKTLKEIFDEDDGYLDWLFNGDKTDEIIKQAITLLTGKKEIKKEDSKEQILNTQITQGQLEMLKMKMEENEISVEKILETYDVGTLEELTFKDYLHAEKVFEKKQRAKKEVF